MSFQLKACSIFDVPVEAYVNTINTVGVMGAGIAKEFKTKYPEMFKEYQAECLLHGIAPGDCWTYKNADGIYLLNLAVKRDWREWATKEWIELSLKSFKLEVLERQIKSVSMPLIGGKNGRRGPWGTVNGFTPPPMRDEIKEWLVKEMTKFADTFKLDVYLCIPEEKVVETKEDKIRIMAKEFFNIK